MNPRTFGLGQKFMLSSIAVISVLMMVIGMFYFNTTNNVLYRIVTADTVALMKKNNQIIDNNFIMLTRYTNGIMVDEDLSRYLGEYQKAASDFDVYALDRPLSTLLNKYFLYANDIFSANLVTRKITYGQPSVPVIIPPQQFENSPLYAAAVESHGKTVWIPTYEFESMFPLPASAARTNPYRRVFSAVKLIREMDNDYAVLVINFLDTLYADVFDNASSPLGGEYFVISREGDVVYWSGPEQDGAIFSGDINKLFPNDNGFCIIDGENIVCYDVSGVTNWISGVIVPRGKLMSIYLPQVVGNLLIILLLLLLIPIFVVALISRIILKPVTALQQGMLEIGKGNFDTVVKPCGTMEFRSLINYFNDMNEQIRNLLCENYEIGVMTKEAWLNAYNLQLNPHFILNSLNIVNLQLMERQQYDLSDMVVELSRMTDYVLNATGWLVPFDKDWEYTCGYIHIMRRRYENQFDFVCDVEKEILTGTVPKFFLQPLIENSITHGFTDLPYKATLRVTAKIQDGYRLFIVEDNGSGISPETERKIKNDPDKSVGINNILKRIEYLYGSDSSLEIHSVPFASTIVKVVLPL